MFSLQIKRAYFPESPEDGYRILVDRLWPRGMSKVKMDLYEWDKQIAPDNEERKAFHDGQEDFETFKKDYLEELNQNPEAAGFVDEVADLLKKGNVTLLYGSKDTEHNNAAVLKEWLEQKLAEKGQTDSQQQKGQQI